MQNTMKVKVKDMRKTTADAVREQYMGEERSKTDEVLEISVSKIGVGLVVDTETNLILDSSVRLNFCGECHNIKTKEQKK